MTALEIRLIAYAVLAFVLLGMAGYLGYHFTSAHYERVIALRDAAEERALSASQDKVIAAQAAQAEATQKAETQYAALKQNYDSLSGHLADSVREYASLRSFLVSRPAGPAPKSDAAGPSPSSIDSLAELVRQATAACAGDSAELTALQIWASSLR